MTHEILQSDIELATRLRGEQRADAEVIQALVQRGVEAGKAAQLLDDLRNKRPVTGASSLPMEFSLRRRSRSRHSASETPERAPAPSPASEVHRRASSHASGRGGQSSKLFRQLFAVLVGVALLAIAIGLFVRYRPGSRLQTERDSPAGVSKPVPAATNVSAKAP